MYDPARLGANIRSLRLAYGETQEQLGEAIHVEKNTVSYYETGKRRIDNETLSAIANYYMISVEELLFSDLTNINKISIDNKAFLKNIDTILPIISSEKAMENENFQNAVNLHKSLYKQLSSGDFDISKEIDMCIDFYIDAEMDDTIKAEVSANHIALDYLMMFIMNSAIFILTNQSAAIKQVISRDSKAKNIISDIDSFKPDIMAFLSGCDDETQKEIDSNLIIIKESNKWSDLAYYYLALKYILNLVDNGLDWNINKRIGAEMMKSYASINNVYAAHFIEYEISALMGSSSQSVDDK